MWWGRTNPGDERDYLDYLENTVLPEIRAIEGSRGARVLCPTDGGGRDFTVLTFWADLDAVKAFAGPSPDTAVVPEHAQALLADYDRLVQHYEVVLESS